MLRVVKLGGSLLGDPVLPAWIKVLAAAGGRIAVVPGGGPFADAVRDAQGRLGLGDAHAHHMALLAMEQYGLALCGMASTGEPGLVPVTDEDGLAGCLARGRTPVWLPTRLALQSPGIPEDWSATSDSLAAWLAARLEAEALALVKHAPVGVHPYVPTLGAALVDDAFPRFAAAYGGPIRILGHGDPGVLTAWLTQAMA